MRSMSNREKSGEVFIYFKSEEVPRILSVASISFRVTANFIKVTLDKHFKIFSG